MANNGKNGKAPNLVDNIQKRLSDIPGQIQNEVPKLFETSMHLGLTALNTFSGSKIVEDLGLRKPAQDLLYQVTKTTVQTGAASLAGFKQVRELLPGDRLARPPKKDTSLFDLTLTPEQEMTREMLSKYAQDELRANARQADDTGTLPDGFFQLAHDMCITAIAIPPALDGAGEYRSPLNSILIGEDLARGDMSLAMAVVAPLSFVNTISEFGSTNQQARYLAAFTQEEPVLGSVAILEKRAAFDPFELDTCARRISDGFVISGTKCMVSIGKDSQAVVVFAKLAAEGIRGFIVETNTPGVTVIPEENMGLAAAGLATIKFDNVKVPAENLLGEAEIEYDHGKLLDLSSIGICSLAVGACQSVVEYVTTYCNDRVAFGEPISHKQSVAFKIADMATELEAMRLLTYRAASRAEQGLDFHKEAYLARLYCNEYSMKIGTDGVQLLGGHGYIKEHPVELWYRQLRAIAVLEGSFVI